MKRFFLILVPGMAAAEPALPVFVPDTGGIEAVFSGEETFMVGGGVAVLDCSGDRKPDLYFAGGEGAGSLWLNQSPVGGALAFARVESGAEVAGVLGAWPLDVDSDGVQDLILLRQGENIALRGLGDCRFERANETWGFDGGAAWSTSFAAVWERGARWPTLAVGNYIDPKEEAFPWGSCTPNWLHRGGETGLLPPLPLTPSFCALSLLFTDWNLSGTPSLRVSNDREYYKGGQEQMWHLPPGEAPRLYTLAEDGWQRLRIWGMGIAQADLNFDGFPEYFLTSMADNKLQVLKDAGTGLPVYADQAFARGVTAHRPYAGDDTRPSTAWHAEFDDVNNDGRMDLYVVKGNVARMPDFAQADPNNLLLQAEDGTFVEVGDRAGVASVRVGRGGAVTDLNLDGKLDLVAVNRWEGAEIWRQTGPAGNWVQVRLGQPGVNRDAIGAVLEIRRGPAVERREVTAGGGHGGGETGWLHLGLGGDTVAEVRVTWPGGRTDPWVTLPAGGFHDLTPGAAPVAWAP